MTLATPHPVRAAPPALIAPQPRCSLPPARPAATQPTPSRWVPANQVARIFDVPGAGLAWFVGEVTQLLPISGDADPGASGPSGSRGEPSSAAAETSSNPGDALSTHGWVRVAYPDGDEEVIPRTHAVLGVQDFLDGNHNLPPGSFYPTANLSADGCGGAATQEQPREQRGGAAASCSGRRAARAEAAASTGGGAAAYTSRPPSPQQLTAPNAADSDSDEEYRRWCTERLACDDAARVEAGLGAGNAAAGSPGGGGAEEAGRFRRFWRRIVREASDPDFLSEWESDGEAEVGSDGEGDWVVPREERTRRQLSSSARRHGERVMDEQRARAPQENAGGGGGEEAAAPAAPAAPAGQRQRVRPVAAWRSYPPGSLSCVQCGATSTPHWRGDSLGRPLCNRCGVRLQREKRHKK